MKKLLITGATGFLGSHLLKILLAETENDIVLIKRSFSNTSRIAKELKNPRIKAYNIDQVSLKKLPWKDIDVVIHCATEYGRQGVPCNRILQTNLLFPIQLLDLAVENGVRAFINTDSYFNKGNLSYSYLRDYALSKKSLNMWLKYFSNRISIINLRLEHIYGPYDNQNKFVEYVIQNVAVHPKKSLDFSPGEQQRDFVYVDDVCKCFVQAINYARKRKFHFKHIDIGSGKLVSVKDFVRAVKKISKSPTQLCFGNLPYREDEIMASCASKPCLPKCTDINQGIRNILELYKK